LTDVGLEIQPEEILAVIGPHGSGKTTFFNCISGVYKADHGRIRFNGESLNWLSPDQVARKGIARTFQNLRLFLHMTVLDNLVLRGGCWGDIAGNNRSANRNRNNPDNRNNNIGFRVVVHFRGRIGLPGIAGLKGPASAAWEVLVPFLCRSAV